MKHEALFQAELERIAPLFGCKIIDIPDIPPLNRYGRVLKKGEKPAISRKLPCDCILVTPQQNYLIECKYGNNVLLPHQKATESKVNAINSTYYVLRKHLRKTKQRELFFYSVEQNGIKLYKTQDISNIFRFFQDPKEVYSQEIMKQEINILIPEKPKKHKLNRTRY